MGSGVSGSIAWMEESGRLVGSAGEAGREMMLSLLSLSTPESDSLSIRSQPAPDLSSSQTRSDLSQADSSERKGL